MLTNAVQMHLLIIALYPMYATNKYQTDTLQKIYIFYTHVCFFLHYSHPHSFIVRLLQIGLMLAIVNTILLLPRITWINLLLFQQGSYRIYRPGVRFIFQIIFIWTIIPECNYSFLSSFRILVQVIQAIFCMIVTFPLFEVHRNIIAYIGFRSLPNSLNISCE